MTTAANHKLVITREFNKPPERVWRAWTDPSQIKTWLAMGDDMAIESVQAELRAGGKFRIQMKRNTDGEYFTAAGSYLEVTAPERVAYTWDWEKDGAGVEFGETEGAESQITVEFHPSGEGTRLVLTHEKLPSAESRDRHQGGWTMWLDRMEQFIRKN